MIWLTWRQLRTQTAAVLAAVAAFALALLVTGPHVRALAKVPGRLFDSLSGTDHRLYVAGIIVTAMVPVVIGGFWGAPLIAREVESGTHRLIWNQSVTRTRWLATKLGVTVLSGALAVGALTLAVTWWSSPLDGAQSTTRGSLPSRLTPISFAMRGVAPVAYVVLLIVLGACVGVVLRRSLPAIAITLALGTFVQIAVPLWVRPHLQTPVTAQLSFSEQTLDSISADDRGPTKITLTTGHRGDWLLSNQTVGANGHATGLPSWLASCLPGPPLPGQAPIAVKSQAPDISSCFTRLNSEGYRQQVVYQPADRFWSLQWRESVLYLVVAGMLTGFLFWWTRRRLT